MIRVIERYTLFTFEAEQQRFALVVGHILAHIRRDTGLAYVEESLVINYKHKFFNVTLEHGCFLGYVESERELHFGYNGTDEGAEFSTLSLNLPDPAAWLEDYQRAAIQLSAQTVLRRV